MTKKRKIGWIAAIVAAIVIIILTSNTTAKKSTFYTIKNIIYKHTKQKDLQLSIYSPKTLSHPTPAIIYFHGGSWISGTRFKIHQRYRQVAIELFTQKNFTIVSVDYRKIFPYSSHLDQAVEDCKDAIEYIFQNAQTLNIDTCKIGLWGSSAGAHLAMLAAFAPDSCLGKCKSNLKNNKKICFIIDDFAPTNIQQMFNKVPKTIKKLISTTFFDIKTKNVKTFDSLTNCFSPINYISKNSIPILIQHGSKDKIVDYQQSITLFNALQQHQVKTELYLYPNYGHGFNTIDSINSIIYHNRCYNFISEQLNCSKF